MNNEISVVAGHNVDRNKWNQCVDKSHNGLVYALTDYLDHMTAQWTGIIINDYEAVLPVPWKKKFGIKYAYAVPFIQQLGLFSAHPKKIDETILKAIFSICPYGEYTFNYANIVNGSTGRLNYVLSLNKPLDEIAKAFSDNTQQRIKRTFSFNLNYLLAEADEVADAYRKLYGDRFSNVTLADYQNFKRLCKILSAQNGVIIKKATDSMGNMLAFILLLRYKNRLYNLMNGTLPEGRSLKANYFLLWNVWKEFDSSNFIFDFEGSDLPGIKEFYENFSPRNEPYFALRFNHLKFPANIFKK